MTENERREMIQVQDEEFKKIIALIAENIPEEDLNEKDELMFLRAEQAQMKFKLSQNEELVKSLKDQLNNKKSVQFAKTEAEEKKTEKDENIKKFEDEKNKNNEVKEDNNKKDESYEEDEDDDGYQDNNDENKNKFNLNRDYYKISK